MTEFKKIANQTPSGERVIDVAKLNMDREFARTKPPLLVRMKGKDRVLQWHREMAQALEKHCTAIDAIANMRQSDPSGFESMLRRKGGYLKEHHAVFQRQTTCMHLKVYREAVKGLKTFHEKQSSGGNLVKPL